MIFIVLFAAIIFGCAACASAPPSSAMDMPDTAQEIQTEENTMPNIKIQVGDISFTAVLYDNASAHELLEKLPLTLDMADLNGNEKYCFFSDSLSDSGERVSNINAGDLMLYGSDCLVLFYESFSSSYRYTKLGYIENVTGLAEALGYGNVQMIFSVQQ